MDQRTPTSSRPKGRRSTTRRGGLALVATVLEGLDAGWLRAVDVDRVLARPGSPTELRALLEARRP